MQSLSITRTTYRNGRILGFAFLLAAIAGMVTVPGVAHAQAINPQLNISLAQDLQNWPLKSGTGVQAGVPTDVVYYVTDTIANNTLSARYWNQNYMPKSQTDTGGGEQNYIISQGPTTLLGNTVHTPTGALPAHFLRTQLNEADYYMYYVTGAVTGGPPETPVYGPILSASYSDLTGLQNISDWKF